MKSQYGVLVIRMNVVTRLLGSMLLVTVLVCGDAVAGGRGRGRAKCGPCKVTAVRAMQASLAESRGDYWLAAGKANTLPDAGDRREAVKEAWEELKEAAGESRDQYRARVDLCEALEETRYHPDIDPDNFLTPGETAAHPNRYLPLIPGTTYTYEGDTEDGPEIIRVYVTDETREILGVTCIVVQDTVWVDGDLVEDTLDWYAQDAQSNVWYFGELSFEYEDGEIAGLEGSWEAGEDGAKPGIVMPASPQVGMVYRQEFLLGEAEDAAEVLALDESVDVDYGSFDDCLKTGEFTPVEPDVYENKFYAPDVGLVLEVNPETGETVELVMVETD